MKRLRYTLLLLILPLFCLTANAANHVTDIKIDATVGSDGSMTVKQVWSGDFTEGTENYIPMLDGGVLNLIDFRAADSRGDYVFDKNWDIDASRSEKARKCGVVPTNQGWELCWGIGEYGNNTYTIQYTIENAVASYPEMDGLNFRFVNDKMNTGPTNVILEIRLADGRAITDEIADIWSFGYHGTVYFQDGAIRADTDTPIEEENHMTVMFGFQKGILSPTRTGTGTFADLQETAFEGSDYIQDSKHGGLIAVIISVLVGGGIVLAVVTTIRRKKKIREFMDQYGYYRDKPNEGNLNASYCLARNFGQCSEESIVGAMLLRLIADGCLIPETDPNGKANLRLAGNPRDEGMQSFYSFLIGAAGADGVLQTKELEKYCKREQNCDRLIRIRERCSEEGTSYLVSKECYKNTGWGNPFSLTERGWEEYGQLFGLKKYLEDFSLIAEREVKETVIWQDYMVYAFLLGIADKVIKQLKELYPQEIQQIDSYGQNIYLARYYTNVSHHAVQELQAQRSGGSGGFSSMGGGGGSIGGGSGGGSR